MASEKIEVNGVEIDSQKAQRMLSLIHIFYRKAQMSALLSEICEKIYPHAPTINNESINKTFMPTVALNSRACLLYTSRCG